MSVKIKLIASIFCMGVLLVGCGGGGDDLNVNVGGGDGTFGSPPDPDTPSGGSDGDGANNSTVSFVPLAVFESDGNSFSTTGNISGAFQGDFSNPLIDENILRPVNVFTGATVTNATLDDFVVTVDDIPVDPTENFSVLQRVIGTPVVLDTALVFDLSDSTNSVDFDALITEARAFVTAARASTNTTIANQRFVVWAFGRTVAELTDTDPTDSLAPKGLTTDATIIDNALGDVITREGTGELGGSSNIHRAIAETIGRFQDAALGLDFVGGNNDLFDRSTNDFIRLTNIVLFSSGTDTFLELEQQTMLDSIQAQSFEQFDSAADDDTRRLIKPLFYYVLGGTQPGTPYSAISDNAELTTLLTLSGGEYDFADQLVAAQIAAIDARFDLDNRYVHRAAFLPRIGAHTLVFASASTLFSQSLTAEFIDGSIDPTLGTPAEVLTTLVEITGPNGEYLARGEAGEDSVQVAAAGSVSLANVPGNRFGFATRWTNQVFTQADYTWSVAGGGATGVTNADGTYTISNLTGTAVVTLTNNTLGARNVAELTITE